VEGNINTGNKMQLYSKAIRRGCGPLLTAAQSSVSNPRAYSRPCSDPYSGKMCSTVESASGLPQQAETNANESFHPMPLINHIAGVPLVALIGAPAI
jgi:hypothetical protein